MASLPTVMTLVVMTALAFSGCVEEDELAADTFRLATEDFPSTIIVGEAFTFSLKAEGALGASSEHIGAHYWNRSVADPTASLADGIGCAHTTDATAVPGTYEVTCTINEAGSHHVYGHIRIMDGDTQFDFWAPGQEVQVLGI